MTTRADIAAGLGLNKTRTKAVDIIETARSPARRICNRCGLTGWTCCALFFLLTVLFAGLFGAYYSQASYWYALSQKGGFDITAQATCTQDKITLHPPLVAWTQHPSPAEITYNMTKEALSLFEGKNFLAVSTGSTYEYVTGVIGSVNDFSFALQFPEGSPSTTYFNVSCLVTLDSSSCQKTWDTGCDRQDLYQLQETYAACEATIKTNIAACKAQPKPKSIWQCFSGSAQVQTPTGVKQMKDLQISDQVLTHDGFSPVYAFGHYDPTAVSTMVHLQTANGHELSLSHDHYMPFTNGSHALAKNVQVGDSVWALDARGQLIESVVANVSLRLEKGLFNPYPHAGTIVVDSVLASAHSSWLFEGLLPETHIPKVYDALLKPLRGLHLIFPKWLARFSERTAGKGGLIEKGVLGTVHAAVSTALSA